METSTSHRPWEASRLPLQNQTPQSTQTLPSISTLTANINHPPPEKSPLNLSMSAVQRDSGNWSMPQSAQPGSSAHSGGAPFSNHSPGRFSGTPYSSEMSAGPTSAGTQSPTSYPSNQHALPSINQSFDPSTQRANGTDFEESRRSSIDIRVHQGMDKLAISPNPASPYTSANASQSSLVSGLQRERGIQPNGYRGSRYSTGGGPLSPLGPRSRGGFIAGRVAPPIMENPTSQIYHAPAPTAGQPYAFPDSDAVPERPGSTYSRRNSFAESFTSSIFTTDSRLPPGQQELPETNTHHHSLQNKQVKEIMEDADSPNSNTPYSRTPELRVTHKLAERKRRSEMKGCFEALRARLPANQSNKSSKWETLSRAIDYINGLEGQVGKYRNENEKLLQQNSEKDIRIKEITQQLQRLQQGQESYATPPSGISHSPMGFGGQFGNPTAEAPRTLPPLMNGVAMQGVQYGDERR